MAFTIENGTGVAGATSYATVVEAQAYAADRGLSLPETEAAVQKLLVKACDYLQTLEDQFNGTRTSGAQPLAWPRQDVSLFGADLDDDVIPDLLKQVQCQLAVDYNTSELLPVGAGREVVSESVGPLSVSYNPSGVTSVKPTPTKALGLLAPLLRSGGGMNLSTLRV